MKKENFRNISLLPALLILLTFCSTGNKKENISRIDTISAQLEQAVKVLDSIHYDTLGMYFFKTDSLIKSVPANFEKPARKDLMNGFVNFSYARPPLQNAYFNYPRIKTEIDYSRNQLKNLKQSYFENQVSEDDFNKYFRTESLAVQTLCNRIKELKEQAEYGIKVHKEFLDSILLFKASIKPKP